jgi:hypothetical protein
LETISTAKMCEQQKILEEAFNLWKGDYKQMDDMTVVGIKL